MAAILHHAAPRRGIDPLRVNFEVKSYTHVQLMPAEFPFEPQYHKPMFEGHLPSRIP
jgi:hypothetical protein